MKKFFVLFVFAVLAILATPETTQAQTYIGGGHWINLDAREAQRQADIYYNRGGVYGQYGYYQQLPPLEAEECQYRECAGRKGTFHYEEVQVTFHGKKTKANELHFRAYDSTHKPFNENHKDCTPIPSAGYTVRENGFATVYHP